MWKAGTAGLMLAAMAIGGCTTRLRGVVPDSTGLVATKQGKAIPEGYAYQLPDLAYRILITRTISKCPKVDVKSFASADEKAQIDVKAVVTASLRPGTPVVIDYQKLGSAMKTTSFEAGNFDSGMIKSVNVSIEDHTAGVITEGAKAVVNVAKLAMTWGAPVKLTSGAVEVTPRIVCTELAASERVLADQAKAGLAQKTKDLATAVAVLEAASKAADKVVKPAAAAAAAASPAPVATPGAAATAAADDLEKKKEAVEAATKAQAAAQEAYDARLRPLTAVQELFYTPGKDVDRPISVIAANDDSQALRLIQEKLEVAYIDSRTPGTVTTLAIGADLRTSAESGKFTVTIANLVEEMAAVLSFRIPNDAWPTPSPVAACTGMQKRSCGILYRTMARGTLLVCRGSDEARCRGHLYDDKGVLARDERVVPQAGMLVSLPLVNGTLVNNTLKASFREDGTLATGTYTSPKAAAEEGLKAANAALGSFQGFAEWRRDEPTQALTRQTAYINALAQRDKAIADRDQGLRDAAKKKEEDRLAAEREVALRTVTGDTEATNALLANANAHLALMEAQKKIEALRNPPSP